MRYSSYILIFFIILLLKFNVLYARNFSLISLDDFGEIDQIRFQDESATQVLSIMKFAPNRNYPIPKNEVIHFYGINSETRKSTRKPLFRISFTDQDTDTIVLLKRGDNSEKITYEFLSNDPITFPKMSTLVMNLLNENIVLKIGSRVIKIRAKERKLILLKNDDNGSFSERVTFANRKGDKTINYFYTSQWRIRSGHKTICVIEKSEDAETPSVSQILL